MNSKMISKMVRLEIFDNVSDAPDYTAKEYTVVKMTKCIIVGKGTTSGNPTIDIQLVAENGDKYLIMATGGVVEMIAGAVAGKRKRDFH